MFQILNLDDGEISGLKSVRAALFLYLFELQCFSAKLSNPASKFVRYKTVVFLVQICYIAKLIKAFLTSLIRIYEMAVPCIATTIKTTSIYCMLTVRLKTINFLSIIPLCGMKFCVICLTLFFRSL